MSEPTNITYEGTEIKVKIRRSYLEENRKCNLLTIDIVDGEKIARAFIDLKDLASRGIKVSVVAKGKDFHTERTAHVTAVMNDPIHQIED